MTLDGKSSARQARRISSRVFSCRLWGVLLAFGPSSSREKSGAYKRNSWDPMKTKTLDRTPSACRGPPSVSLREKSSLHARKKCDVSACRGPSPSSSREKYVPSLRRRACLGSVFVAKAQQACEKIRRRSGRVYSFAMKMEDGPRHASTAHLRRIWSVCIRHERVPCSVFTARKVDCTPRLPSFSHVYCAFFSR